MTSILSSGLDTSGGFGFAPFLKDRLLDTTSLRERDLGFLSVSDNENVAQSCGESVAFGILHCDNRERTVVLFDVHKSSDTSTVMTLGDHNHSSQAEFVDVRGLSGGDGDLDGVVDLNIGVGVTEGASVMCDSARDLVGSNVNLVDSAKLELGFFAVKANQNVSSLDVVHKSETIVGLRHLDDIHETSRVVGIGADLSVNLDATFHADLLAFLSGQSILKTFTENNGNGQALTKLVRSLGGSRSPDSPHLADVPMLRSMEALQVLFRSTSPSVKIMMVMIEYQ